jgi:hypothetical protein
MNIDELHSKYPHLEFIPATDLDIKSNKWGIAYDLTVEDYYTFTTAKDLFVYDTMSVFVPMSKEAQKEAKEKMLSIKSAEGIGSVSFNLTNECLTGLFTLTSEKNNNAPKHPKNMEEVMNLHPGDNVVYNFKGKTVKTTAGRLLFNSVLPEFFDFLDMEVTKKSAGKIFTIIAKHGTPTDYANTIDGMMRIGFRTATLYARTFSIDMLEMPPSIMKLKEKLRQEKDILKQQDIINEMTDLLKDHIKKHNKDLYQQIESGAAKGIGQLRQLLVCKGILSDPQGNILPAIASSIGEGYKPEEYFEASAAARAGLISTAKLTAFGGYTYRKMVYVMNNMEADIRNVDCGTRMMLKIKLTEDLFNRLQGRYVQEEFGKPIRPVTEDMIGSVISLRSPVYCKSLNVCRTCYGELLKQLKSKHIGLIAAQEVASLSEKIMKSRHTGGAVDINKPDIIKFLMENLPDRMRSAVDKVCRQEDVDLVSNTRHTLIEIDKKLYHGLYSISETDKELRLPVGYFNITFDNFEIKVTIEQDVYLYLEHAVREEDGDFIRLTYTENSKLFRTEPINLTPQQVAQRIDQYVGGKSPFTDPESLYTKFYKTYSTFGNWDSCHLETIIGHIIRWKHDPKIPARVKYPYEFELHSIKKLPGLMSYPLGIAYENMNSSIARGMIEDRSTESSIEKVLFGEPLSDIAKEQLLKRGPNKKKR